MHKIQFNNYQSFMTDRVTSLQIPHEHLTRFKVNGNLTGPRSRTTRSQQSFLYMATKSWNSIPKYSSSSVLVEHALYCTDLNSSGIH